MSELKILGKIDLNQFSKDKKPHINMEESFRFLNKELENISLEFGKSYGDFIEKDGSIKMIGQDEKFHKDIVSTKSEIYGDKKDFPQMAELAITVFLNKIIGDRFIVVRSSKYDDYEHGVDNVLVDKKTGFVVCGFDQVLGIGNDDGSSKKREKVEKINQKGGAKLEYGIKLDENQKIQITKMKNIPAFFLGLTKDDLISLVKNMTESKDSAGLDKSILNKIWRSLKEQEGNIKNLLKNGENLDLLSNIKKFEELLSFLQSKV